MHPAIHVVEIQSSEKQGNHVSTGISMCYEECLVHGIRQHKQKTFRLC